MNREPSGRGHRINWLLRIIVGGGFVTAGILKIIDPASFADNVANYRLARHELINLVAIILPWIEVVAGLLVLTGIWLRAAALVIAALTVVFLVVIVSALARGLNIQCGCFGTVGGTRAGWFNLVIDLSFLGLALWLARRAGPKPVAKNFNEAGVQPVCTTT
jgi:putative oxidoreductase